MASGAEHTPPERMAGPEQPHHAHLADAVAAGEQHGRVVGRALRRKGQQGWQGVGQTCRRSPHSRGKLACIGPGTSGAPSQVCAARQPAMGRAGGGGQAWARLPRRHKAAHMVAVLGDNTAQPPPPPPNPPLPPAHLVPADGAGKNGVEDELLAKRHLQRQLLCRPRQISHRLQRAGRGGEGKGDQQGRGPTARAVLAASMQAQKHAGVATLLVGFEAWQVAPGGAAPQGHKRTPGQALPEAGSLSSQATPAGLGHRSGMAFKRTRKVQRN